MTRIQLSLLAPTACLMSALLIGCNNAPAPNGAPAPNASTPPADVHAHPTKGPHHGDLVELGNEAYHAEIVHGEGGEVTVYILDSQAASAVPIDATEVAINLTHDGNAEQFKLPAAPDTSDPSGQSSRFTLKDTELAEDLDHEGTDAKLVVSINGKSYTGKIEHKHEEGGSHVHK